MHDLDSALAVIRARDDTAAKHAHALWQVMRATAAHPTKVTRYEVQQMVWGTLPLAARRVEATEPFADLHDTCSAFAELLDLLGHTGYADLCRGETTRSILDADEARYPGLVERAWRESGVYPPNPPTLAWSDQAGDVEQALRAAAGRLLEEGVEDGTLSADGADSADDPERVELVMRLLMSPDAGGDSWFDRLLDERVGTWTKGKGSQTRRELLVRLAPDVRRTPDADGHDLPALASLLDACRGQGAKLTERGYLPTDLVAELAALMPTAREHPPAGRGETRWPPVRMLRDLATEFDLVEARGRRLVLTERGGAVVDDPDSLLMAVGEAVIAPDRPALAVIEEVVFAALLMEDRMSPERIFAKITHVLAEDGWADADGVPFGSAHAEKVGSWLLRRLRVLDALDADWTARRVGLTPAGVSIARWALRTRVLFPQTTIAIP